MLEERLVPMGSKARKAKNPIGCLADRCKSGVPINMVWWNRVTENNLQVNILFLDIFESEYFGCFLCLCGVVGIGFFFFWNKISGPLTIILFCGIFALSLLLCSYFFIKFSFSCWILLTMQFIFNTQSCSGYYIKKSYYKTDYRKHHLFGIWITESSMYCLFVHF